MPDVADLLKTYTRQVASLNPVASTSKVLTTTTFDGSAVYFTRRPRRREGAATTALVSDALKSFPLRDMISNSFQRRAGVLPQKGRQFKNLLDVPIHRMLEDLDSATAAKLAAE